MIDLENVMICYMVILYNDLVCKDIINSSFENCLLNLNLMEE